MRAALQIALREVRKLIESAGGLPKPRECNTLKGGQTCHHEANPDNDTSIITMREGEGEVIGGGRSWQVISGQQAIFAGTDTLDYELRDAGSQPLSEFDRLPPILE